MSRKLDFVVGQPTLLVCHAKSADTVDDKAVVLDRRLEALLVTPGHILYYYSRSVLDTSAFLARRGWRVETNP